MHEKNQVYIRPFDIRCYSPKLIQIYSKIDPGDVTVLDGVTLLWFVN